MKYPTWLFVLIKKSCQCDCFREKYDCKQFIFTLYLKSPCSFYHKIDEVTNPAGFDAQVNRAENKYFTLRGNNFCDIFFPRIPPKVYYFQNFEIHDFPEYGFEIRGLRVFLNFVSFGVQIV